MTYPILYIATDGNHEEVYAELLRLGYRRAHNKYANLERFKITGVYTTPDGLIYIATLGAFRTWRHITLEQLKKMETI